MSKIALISLVSRETIPNFLSIKTFSEANYFFFLTSKEMEDEERGNRREWLIKAACLEKNSCDFRIVDAYKKEDVIIELEKINWHEFNKIIVNITGGTKIMAIAAYEFFSLINIAEIWYTPENNNTNYYKIDNHLIKRTIEYKTNVEEYLKCRGIEKEEKHYSEKSITFDIDHTNLFFDNFINGKINKESLESLRTNLRGDNANNLLIKKLEKGLKLYEKQLDDSSNFNELEIKERIKNNLIDLGQDDIVKSGIITKDIVTYLTGGWFEEYVYNLLLQEIVNPSFIKLGVVLNQKPRNKRKAHYFTNNDLDIVFTNNNVFCLIECKSGGMTDKELFNKTAYTASALRKYFGLTVKSVLCTLSELTEAQKEKAEILDITVFDFSFFKNKDNHRNIFKLLNL